MSVNFDKEIRQRKRETLKEKRHEFHRIKESVDLIDRDHMDWETYHGWYHGRVRSWIWRLHAQLSSAAEKGLEPYREIWEDRTFGDHTGLEEVFEQGFMGEEEPLPAPVLEEIGAALERVSVVGFDLPEHPPVVEERWTPDELPTAEELEERIKELEEESKLSTEEFDEF